jgi:hypothetical protein
MRSSAIKEQIGLLVIWVLIAATIVTAPMAIGKAYAASYGYQTGAIATSLSAVAVTGAGDDFAMPAEDMVFTWQTIYTGTPTAINVKFEGTLDNTNWFQLDVSTSTTSEMRHVVDKNVRRVRCNISSYTVNGSTATCAFYAVRRNR